MNDRDKQGSPNDSTTAIGGSAEDPTLPPASAVSGEPVVDDRGRCFGNYELLDEIARGGMGIVYRARQIDLNRIVALKMILAGDLAGEEEVRRFKSEAESAAQLDHLGIVPIFEIGEHRGQHYFSMGFVEGESLADRLHVGPLPPGEAAELMEKICDAVAYAHGKGVVHRDLKPANVLIDLKGHPRVTDFGLAKRIEGDSELTRTGQILGTPAFMPPEQASGALDQVGPHSDVYALGAILYAMLTGRPPFQAANPMDTLRQVLEREPAAPRTLNPAVPKDLETICLKCLEKEPGRRYEGAAAVAADLRRFRGDEPILARPIGHFERLMRGSRKQAQTIKAVATTVALLATVIIIGLASAMIYDHWQTGYLVLRTNGMSLQAEVFDAEGEERLALLAVPTQAPIPLEQGEYQVRLSGPGLLSETSILTVNRGATQEFQVGLGERHLWKPMALGAGEQFDLIELDGQTDIILLEERFGSRRLRRLDGATARSVWQIPLDNDMPPDGLAEDLRESWTDLAANWSRWRRDPSSDVVGKEERSPQLLRDAPDLDGDGIGDVVFYWPQREDGSILAISGKNGSILWWKRQDDTIERSTRPLMVNLEGQGTPAIVYSRQRDGEIVVEALGAPDGQSLWQTLVPKSMQAAPGKEGEHQLQIVQVDGQKRLALIASNRVCTFALQSGKLDGGGVTIESPLKRPLHLGDLDGDGSADVLALTGEEQSLVALDLQSGQQHWSKTIVDAKRQSFGPEAEPNWPLVVDLDADEEKEIVSVEHHLDGLYVELIRGAGGDSSWKSPARLSYEAGDRARQVLAVEDINSDRHDDLIVVSELVKWPRRKYFLIDLISGRDGRRLATRYTSLPATLNEGWRIRSLDHLFESARLWERDARGVPSLLLAYRPDDTRQIEGSAGLRRDTNVEMWSLPSGTRLHVLSDIEDLHAADFNGDGLKDLCYVRRTPEGARLFATPGQPPEIWRRLGNAVAAGDLSGDGVGDFIQSTAQGPFSNVAVSFSGADGSMLDRWSIDWPGSYEHVDFLPQPASGPNDIDRDGISDFLVKTLVSSWGSGDLTSPRVAVQMISGRTARRLWITEELARFDDFARLQLSSRPTVKAVEPHWQDLDNDGQPELVIFFEADARLSGSGRERAVQFGVAGLDARSGRLLWTSLLSDTIEFTEPNGHSLAGPLPSQLPLKTADLNGDSIQDIVTVSLLRDEGGRIRNAVVATNGADGSRLWTSERSVHVTEHDNDPSRQGFLLPVVGQLGFGETASVAFVERASGSSSDSPKFNLYVLDGATGEYAAKWSWKDDYSWGEPELRYGAVQNGGFLAVTANPEEQPSGIVVLNADTEGDLVPIRRLRAARHEGFVVYDVDGDQKEDLIYVDRDAILAADYEGRRLWEHRIPNIRYPTGPKIFRTPTAHDPTLVYQASLDNTYLAMDAHSGELMWRGEALPRMAGGQSRDAPLVVLRQVQTEVALTAPQSPLRSLISQHIVSGSVFGQIVSSPTLPVDRNGKYRPRGPLSVVGFQPRPDPRLVQSLPWVRGFVLEHIRIELFLLVLATGLFVFVLPGWILGSAILRWRWTLRQWLTVPVVIALALVMLQPLSDSAFIRVMSQAQGDASVLGAIVLAAVGASCLLFPLELFVLALRKGWKIIVWLVTLTPLAAIIWAAGWILVDRSQLRPQMSYSWEGWWFIGLLTAYAAGWVYLALYFLWRAFCAVRSRMTRS